MTLQLAAAMVQRSATLSACSSSARSSTSLSIWTWETVVTNHSQNRKVFQFTSRDSPTTLRLFWITSYRVSMIDSSDFPPTRKYLRQQLRPIRSHSRRAAQEKQDEVQASDVSIKSINQIYYRTLQYMGGETYSTMSDIKLLRKIQSMEIVFWKIYI